MKGLEPSTMLPTATPLSVLSCMGVRISDGFSTSLRPEPVISKMASSSVEPKRFLMLRRMRCE